MTGGKDYLGVPVARPRVAFFEFTSCEGCQLQILNNEETLLDFLALLEVVNFREAMSGGTEDFDIAFVEGSITRGDEKERLRAIRERATTLVAFGSCACFGGVNALKNRFVDKRWRLSPRWKLSPEVEGEARPVEDFVGVDLRIYGCPVRKEEVERIVTDIVIGKKVREPAFPVCMECRGRENVCVFDLGEACLGPVTRAGCDAWCPTNRRGCWGCRGPAEDANVSQLMRLMEERGFDYDSVMERLDCFGGFGAWGRTREDAGAQETPLTGRGE